jgi:hypothetical protein
MIVRVTMRRRRKRRTDPRQTPVGQHHLYVLSLLRDFIARRGWGPIARKRCVVRPGVDLAGWVQRRRTAYRQDRIADWLAEDCEKVPGWTWEPLRDAKRKVIDRIRHLVRAHGWERFPAKAGFLINRWLVRRRDEYRRRVLARWILDALEAIPGWSWDPRAEHYARNLRELRGYVARHGWKTIFRRTQSPTGVALGQWVSHIRAVYRRGSVPQWLVAGLESVPGWVWDPRANRQRTRIAQLETYVAQHGWSELSGSTVVRGVKLGLWVSNCRARYRNGTLSPETRRALARIPGWSWVGRTEWSRVRNRQGRFVPGRPRVRARE